MRCRCAVAVNVELSSRSRGYWTIIAADANLLRQLSTTLSATSSIATRNQPKKIFKSSLDRIKELLRRFGTFRGDLKNVEKELKLGRKIRLKPQLDAIKVRKSFSES
jgi:hypothetical protein